MRDISLRRVAKLTHGQLVCGHRKKHIPLAVSKIGRGSPASITFLSKPIVNELNWLNLFSNHGVNCVMIKAGTRLDPDKWSRAGISIIEVPSLNRAYRELATFYRAQFHIPLVQVIGSSGKTTTKEMIGSVLNENFPTLTSVQNMNSPNGVANCLFNLNNTHRAAVVETGMKAAGIIRISSRMTRPDIGVITSIHSAHLTRLGSIANIIDAKSEILEYLSPQGCLIINWDDPNCRRFPYQKYPGKLLRLGFSEQCDLWASNIRRHKFSTDFTAHTRKLRFNCRINILGRYNVSNALAAIAVGIKLGLTPDVISQGLENFQAVGGRLKVYYQNDGSIIIDDHFNANPDSTRLLVDELIIMAREQPVALVIGDMERPSPDIESYARRVHFKIGRQLAQGEFEHILAIGRWAWEYVRGAVQAGFPPDKISYFKTVQAAENSFVNLLNPGTTVVLKASPYTPLKDLLIENDIIS